MTLQENKRELEATERLFAQRELEAMGFSKAPLSLMRSKDGITLWRLTAAEGPCVLKCFDNVEYRREISNYGLLASLGIPTLPLVAKTDRALLMEDIEKSAHWRLGKAEDLLSRPVARALARWYKVFHEKGKTLDKEQLARLYRESDDITNDHMTLVMERSQTGDQPFWALFFEGFDRLKEQLEALPATLLYNDFYWTNFIVAKDESRALMFDYNLLGRGYVYSDIRNVTSALSPEAAEAFLGEYGDADTRGKAVDDVIGPLFTLYTAFKQERFPAWAEEALHQLRKGELFAALERLLTPPA